jgi:hypothetical protein
MTSLETDYVGFDFGCAIKTDRNPWCWGDDERGVDDNTYWLAGPYPRGGNPVSQVVALSSRGRSGFSNAMRYLTWSGAYYQGPTLVPTICP